MSSIHTSARSDAPALRLAPRLLSEERSDETKGAQEPQTEQITDLSWRQADEDVFVATNRGEYAGFVTVEQNVHVVHDSHSRRIGSYPTLAAARQALVDATRPPSRRRERLRRRILERRR